MTEHAQPRRLGPVIAGVLSCLLVVVYFLLPGGEEEFPSSRDTTPIDAEEAAALGILDISPDEPAPGSAVFVRYASAGPTKGLRVFGGKRELETLAERPGVVVAKVPSAMRGRLKLRIVHGEDRSRSYPLTVRPVNFREKYRNLVGGVALLAFAISILTRGLRETVSLQSSRRLARWVKQRGAALGFGVGIGALSQSTAAVSGLLSGLVTSNVLGVSPAGAAFLGAQIGATLAPGLALGFCEPREGLLVVALGVLWLFAVTGRRAQALSRVVMGAGLIGVALYVLRPGLEPFLANPAFLAFMAQLRADHLMGIASSALLGALLVFVLQGPAPVLLLVLATARITGHVDLPTALAVMSGSGLGSGLGALWTTPVGRRARRLAELNLALGAASTLLVAAGVHLWSLLAEALVSGTSESGGALESLVWPQAGSHLVVGFFVAQVAASVLLLPALGPLGRALDALRPTSPVRSSASRPDEASAVQRGLAEVVRAQRRALADLSKLVLEGERRAGHDCERWLAGAGAALETPLAAVSSSAAPTRGEFVLSSLVCSCLQMQRGLEGLLSRTELLTDERLMTAAEPGQPLMLSLEEVRVIEGMQALLMSGLDELAQSLEAGTSIDLEEARGREIRMNALESSARDGLPAGGASTERMRVCLAVLAVVDAYEVAGNHVYRMAERRSETYSLEAPSSGVVWGSSFALSPLAKRR